MGIRFTGGRKAYLQAGLAGALGTVEVRPIDLTSAYGSIANGGVHVPPRMILEIRGPDGTVVWHGPEPRAARRRSRRRPRSSSRTSSPATRTRPRTRSGRPRSRSTTARAARGARPRSRPAPPTTPATWPRTASCRRQTGGRPSIAVGVWMGNSDHSNPRSRKPATSLTAAAPLWRAFMREYTNGWPVTQFVRPKGVVKATIDAWSGGKPGSVDARRRPRNGSSTARSPAPAGPSTPTASCTAGRAAATAWISSRRSSGRAPGIRTWPTGCDGRAGARA